MAPKYPLPQLDSGTHRAVREGRTSAGLDIGGREQRMIWKVHVLVQLCRVGQDTGQIEYEITYLLGELLYSITPSHSTIAKCLISSAYIITF